MKKIYQFRWALFLGLMSLFSVTYAQNGAPCYKPLTGSGKTATAINNGTSISFTTGNEITNITNADNSDYAEISNLLTLLSGQGVAVVDSAATYPAGWHAGFVMETGSDVLLNADVLNGMRIETYNNGSLMESFVAAGGTGVTVLSGDLPGRIYLNFPTTQSFDEVRLIKGTLASLSLATSLRVYHAVAFDPNCGYDESNGICEDQIAGGNAIVNFNGGLLTSLATLANAQNIINGNKNQYATLTLPVRASLASTSPYIGVKHLEEIYPGGYRAGFRVQSATGLLTATVLSSLSIRTYLHGVLQDETPVSSNGVVRANLLASTSPVQDIFITTTAGRPFNEVRLVQTGISAAINTIRIYGALEGPANCGTCNTALTSATAPYALERRTTTRPDLRIREGLLGVTVGASLSPRENIVTPSLADSVHYDAVAGIGAGFRMTLGVVGGTDIPSGTVVGFAVSVGGGLLETNVLGGFSIRLYRNGGNTPVQTISSGSLTNIGLLPGNGSINMIGGRATVAFDEIEIQYTSLLDVGPDVKVYYAYIQLDSDGDGTPDCNDQCAGSDVLDSDGDGIPDPCDPCSEVNAKSPFMDHDGDGTEDACDDDSDGDGIPDDEEDVNGDGDPTNDDADGDGIPNYLDLDSDNDGILDSVEGSGDADADGVPNYLDLDSDNDGVFDLTENGITGAFDSDNNGVLNGMDDDNDGIMNSVDQNSAEYGSPSHPTPVDTDSDSTPDYLDLDSDNDGTFDIVEAGGSEFDTNNDGRVDDATDADGDGIMDAIDSDDAVFGSPGGTTLPVTLVSFTATAQGKTALLNWQTSSENNSSHFEVHRKSNGTDWKEIGEVKAAGNSSTDIEYEFTDVDPGQSIVFYRLKMVDLDGKFTYSPIQSLQFNGDAAITVYPNPVVAGTQMNINTGNYTGKATVRITDMYGRTVKQQSIRMMPGAVIPMNTNGLSQQMYSILIVDETGKKLMQTKLMISQ